MLFSYLKETLITTLTTSASWLPDYPFSNLFRGKDIVGMVLYD